jgi:predicted dehydrogenase
VATLGVGLIGCGRLAERGYVNAIRRARGVRLVAVADVEQGRCRDLEAGVPVYADAASLIAAGAAEAAVVATPAARHLEAARLASAAEMPALIEKPPAVSAAEAATMAELDPPPSFGFNRRFEPGIASLRDRVPASGEFELAIALHHDRGSWDSYVVSDDALLKLGPHLIDLARWLTDSEIAEVRTLELDATRATLELSLGRGRAWISCSTDSRPLDRIEVRQGDRPLASYVAGGFLRRGMRRLRRPLGAGALVRSLALQLEAFASLARGERVDGLGTAEDGIAVMRVIEAARGSR